MYEVRKSVRELHEIGLQDVIDKAAEREKQKIGTLRGGNAGFVLDGKPAASCPRKAWLRKQGVDLDPTTPDKQLLFDGGLSSEDYFFDRVRVAWEAEGGTIAQEEEWPSRWATSKGTWVTGRPDGVLLLKDGKAVKGVEKKGIFSLWTARDIMERKPKYENLCQSAQYMWALGLQSYELVYVSRSYYAANEMASKVLPKYGQPYSEYVDYRFYEWRPKKRGAGWTRARISQEDYDAGDKTEIVDVRIQDWSTGELLKQRKMRYEVEPGNIKPFCVSFELRSHGAEQRLQFKDTTLAAAEWQDTDITWSSIREWYEMADSIEAAAKLPDLPRNPKIGSSRDKFSMCNYCPLKADCVDKKIRTGAELLEAARKLSK